MPRESKLTRLLLTICVVLACVTGVEWFFLNRANDQSRLELKRPVNSDLEFEKVSKHEFTLPPKEKFSEAVERPLMIQGRRPVPEVVEEEPVKAPPKPIGKIQVKLMGIIITPDKKTALLQDGKGKYKNMLEKDTIDGWELQELSEDSVVLVQADLREELKLRKPKSKKPLPTAKGVPRPNQKPDPNAAQPDARVPPQPLSARTLPMPGQPGGPMVRMPNGRGFVPSPIPQSVEPGSE